MPYVRREPAGRLLSLHRRSEAGAEEFVADGALEVQAFLQDMAPNNFSQLDAGFVRVLEDLIDVLISRHLINITDLPAAAQDKLAARRSHRHLGSLGRLNLLGDEVSTPGYTEPDAAALSR